MYHCTATALEDLNRIQKRFLKEVGLTAVEALCVHNLAPLQTRRDIAMLGLVHRTVLGQSAPQFSDWFFVAARVAPKHNTRRQDKLHTKQLHDWLTERDTELLRRSALGLVRVYNKLPQKAVDFSTVKGFQSWLREEIKKAAKNNKANWQNFWNRR